MIVHGKAVAGIFLHDAVIVGLLQDLDPFEDRIALVDVVNAFFFGDDNESDDISDL